jgi:hypothetical protein
MEWSASRLAVQGMPASGAPPPNPYDRRKVGEGALQVAARVGSPTALRARRPGTEKNEFGFDRPVIYHGYCSKVQQNIFNHLVVSVFSNFS